MSFLNFSEYLFVRISNESETVKIATHEIVTGGELGNMRVMVYLKGSVSGNIQLKIYPKDNASVPICSSNIVDISTIGSDFLGFVRFDFQRENFPNGAQFDIFADVTSYTRSGEVSYLSLVFDFPCPVYDNSEASFIDHPIAIEDFFYI